MSIFQISLISFSLPYRLTLKLRVPTTLMAETRSKCSYSFIIMIPMDHGDMCDPVCLVVSASDIISYKASKSSGVYSLSRSLSVSIIINYSFLCIPTFPLRYPGFPAYLSMIPEALHVCCLHPCNFRSKTGKPDHVICSVNRSLPAQH